jgi:putative addiction module component (TIGR02574 family)
MQTEAVLNEALKLPPIDRASIIDRLLASFDLKERSGLDQAWAAEAESRIDAYDKGKLKARPVADVLKKINA